jgi:hypothetical protein
MRKINQRTKPLTQKEKEDFYYNHLPYRVEMLTTCESIRNEFINRREILTCTFEASIIACRVLLEFLGLGIDGSNPPKLIQRRNYYSQDKINSYEIKIVDLGGDFVNISSINKEDQDILAKSYLTGHLATAHLTFDTPYKTYGGDIPAATRIIRELLEINLEKKLNIKIDRKKAPYSNLT